MKEGGRKGRDDRGWKSGREVVREVGEGGKKEARDERGKAEGRR